MPKRTAIQAEKKTAHPTFKTGDPDLYSERGLAWRYLPSFREAVSERKRLKFVLKSARPPRKYPVTDLKWIERKAEYNALSEKLHTCKKNRRCGSLACIVCRRADAQVRYCRFFSLLNLLMTDYNKPDLVFATIIPDTRLSPPDLIKLDVRKMQQSLRRLLDIIGISPNEYFGIMEISYEEIVNGDNYFQPHWHIIIRTSAAKLDQLRKLFPNPRAVYVRSNVDTGVIKYFCKAKEKGHRRLADAPSTARVLPQTRQRDVALWLDRWSPADFELTL